MATRGRKSLASIQALPVTNKVQSVLKAPEGLTKPAAELWEGIVRSLPTDYFRPGDQPLLQAYCTAYDRKNQIDALIAQEGILINGESHSALKTSREEATLLATLATKLRLCQSSRTRADAAELQKSYPTAKKPWE